MLIYQELVLSVFFDRHGQRNESSRRMARWSIAGTCNLSAPDSVPKPSLSEIIKSSEDYEILRAWFSHAYKRLFLRVTALVDK